MEDDNRTMYDLVKNALQVQNACNLSGVVHSFSDDIRRLRTLIEGTPGFSTDMLNRHPICILYSSKIAQLSGSEVGARFSRAYSWCRDVQIQGAVDYGNGPRPVLPILPPDAN